MQTPNTWVFQSHQRKKKKGQEGKEKNISGREEMGRMIFQSQCENESETPISWLVTRYFRNQNARWTKRPHFCFKTTTGITKVPG